MPTQRSIMALRKANKTILSPEIKRGMLKYNKANNIAKDSNIKITENIAANLCIQDRLFLLKTKNRQ